MKLRLELAPPWQPRRVEQAGEALVFVWPELAVRLHTTSLHAPPAREGVAGLSALGWPVQIDERDPATIRVVYHLFEMAGTVVVTAPAAAIAAHRDELLAAALGARPDWSGDVACVSDLFADVAFGDQPP